MNLLQLKQKLEKGKILGGEVVYIKEDNILYGIHSIYEDQENKNVTLIKSQEESIKVDDLLKLINEIYCNIGDKEVFISNSKDFNRDTKQNIKNIEFAQYELLKMIFINS